MPPSNLLSVPSRDVVWAYVGGNLLFRSIDRGSTWEKRSAPPSNPMERLSIVGFSFVDAQEGWSLMGSTRDAQCTGTKIWHTKDGGATWQEVAVETWTPSYPPDSTKRDSECREGLSFIDPLHGFVAASVPGIQTSMYRTIDGGKNWSGSPLPDPPDFKTGSGFSLRAGLVKRFGSTLYVVASGLQGGDARQYMFRSTDGGASWSWMTKIPPRNIVMVTESRWLRLLVPGQSMESINSGQQWHPYQSDFNTTTSVGGPQVFADSQVGYAEERGVAHRTADGGAHWERITNPGSGWSPPPTSSPVALLPVTDPGFTCRLAVDSRLDVSPLIGGVVAVPGGPLKYDPAAPLAAVNEQRWTLETPSQPVLKGTVGLTFDAPFSRWVPASPELLSSDGSEYVWMETYEPPQRLHVTKVVDGTDRNFAVDKPLDSDHFGSIPIPLGMTKDGVFLTYGWEGTYGVWRLDLASGSLTKVTGLPSPSYGAGAVWVEVTRGPNRVGMYSDGDTLARVDLKSGAVQDWFHRDNVLIRHIGFDLDGNPWVQAMKFDQVAGPQAFEIWRVRGPGQADLIISGQHVSRVLADSHGTWFGNQTGVYLYAGGRVQRVSAASVGEVVGPCI
jgi:photosystem II stability/assembly factor-like uncharacterized protein